MTESERKVDVGLVGECEPWRLRAHLFPSKVGGRPAWLHRIPPSPDRLECGVCREPLVFLCQVYAPVDECAEAFHRTLFVFVCRNGSCHQPNDSRAVKVFRSQLERDNEFYSYDPPSESENVTFDDSKGTSLCYVCGSRGPSHCSKCKKVKYCSKSHQIHHWKNGHRENCEKGELEKTNIKNGILFPELELIIEEENEFTETKTTEERELQYLNKLIEEKKAGCLSDVSETELEQYVSESTEDKVFFKFKERVSREPEQVLRYDRGGEPLWISSKSIPSEDQIPNCQYCNSKRQFECQVMPQLLNFLNIEFNVNSIDWGVLVIYTCVNHCSEKNTPYKSEHVFKQDINSNDSE